MITAALFGALGAILGVELIQWYRNKKPTVHRQDLIDKLNWQLEKAWQCWVLGKHLEKFSSNGLCYRCGKRIHAKRN